MENDNVYFDKVKTKGRPRLVLNEEGKETVVKLASMMCTDEEIASVLEVTVDTLLAKHNEEAFSECKKRGQDMGKASLRRVQFQQAERGNATMAIWLGKQYLGQRDRQDLNVEAEHDYTLNIIPASSVTKESSEE